MSELIWQPIGLLQLRTKSNRAHLVVTLIPTTHSMTWLISVNDVEGSLLDEVGGNITQTARQVMRGERIIGTFPTLQETMKQAEKFANEWLANEEE
jgi:hypothetical protein